MRYKVNFGYDRTGRPRNRYFSTIEDAKDAADLWFRRTGVIVAVTVA